MNKSCPVHVQNVQVPTFPVNSLPVDATESFQVSKMTAYCESKGWHRIYDKTREDYTLKWCETKSVLTYYNFREGEQLLYQIPNNKVLTTKIGLLNSLRDYEKASRTAHPGHRCRRLKMEDFFPTTFRMDIKDERDAFFSYVEGPGNLSPEAAHPSAAGTHCTEVRGLQRKTLP
uniref:Tubulin tyrosine ligase like 10 n=1 Tax=Scleropages formosus TaxID=113540 RepID=A0A8C9WJX4_SCLFO